jgi:Family of unknown function (DUF6629)
MRMCFSATASFVTVGTTTAVGIACLSKVRQWRELPLASLPLIFAVQQAIEGCLWLTLPVDPDGPLSSLLTLLFLLYAKVFWPAFAPITTLLVEPEPRRRQLMIICAAAGASIAAFFLWSIYAYPHGAIIRGGHIVYTGEAPSSISIAVMYLAATTIAPLLSTHRAVVLLGAIVFCGSLLAYFMYWETFASVWCFFAAAGSVVILVHFERVRQVERFARAGA